MPTVKKQVAKPKAKIKSKGRSDSVLDRIAPVSDDDSGLRFALYGRTKTGKTRLACTFPKPVLIMGFEKGTKSVANIKGVDFVRIWEPEEVPIIVEHKLLTGDYATVVVDQASEMQNLILARILGIDKMPEQGSWGMASREEYGQCALQTKELLRSILTVAENSPVNAIIVAHERNFNEESGGDLLLPSVGAALSPSVTNWLNGACDYICQTFIKEKTTTRTTMIKGKSVTMSTPAKGADYCLRIGPHPVYMTGFRQPPGSKELAEYIVDPTYDKINKLIQGE